MSVQEYVNSAQFAKKMGISRTMVDWYLRNDRIDGALRDGKKIKIPVDAKIKDLDEEAYVKKLGERVNYLLSQLEESNKRNSFLSKSRGELFQALREIRAALEQSKTKPLEGERLGRVLRYISSALGECQ